MQRVRQIFIFLSTKSLKSTKTMLFELERFTVIIPYSIFFLLMFNIFVSYEFIYILLFIIVELVINILYLRYQYFCSWLNDLRDLSQNRRHPLRPRVESMATLYASSSSLFVPTCRTLVYVSTVSSLFVCSLFFI